VAVGDRYRCRVPKIACSKPFDVILLVLLNKISFEPIEIWRAERKAVKRRLSAPGSKARNERSQTGISQCNQFPMRALYGHRPASAATRLLSTIRKKPVDARSDTLRTQLNE
jgi:hypothetical protein